MDSATPAAWLANFTNTDVLLVPINAQNAMLILRRNKDTVIFECFEASPLANAVMECKGSLVRTFPAQARAVHVSTFDDPQFRNELATVLSKLDMEVINEMMPQSQKAGSTMAETRDTAHPGLVSDMLMAILAAVGQSVQAQQLSKRTRDDVLWSDTLLPWRRSPLWLAIRVTIQMTLYRMLSAEQGHIQYKNFMISLVTEIASRASAAGLPDDLCHIIVAKVARRASKLGPMILNSVQDKALTVCREVNSRQKRSWKAICDNDGKRQTTFDSWNFERDTGLSLDTSSQYLDIILDNDHKLLETEAFFTPRCQSWLSLNYGLPSLDDMNTIKDEKLYTLAEFELWSQVVYQPGDYNILRPSTLKTAWRSQKSRHNIETRLCHFTMGPLSSYQP